MTKDIITKHENINTDAIINELGELLFNAGRATIVYGAVYDEGEYVDKDARGAWNRVANYLVEAIIAARKTHDEA